MPLRGTAFHLFIPIHIEHDSFTNFGPEGRFADYHASVADKLPMFASRPNNVLTIPLSMIRIAL